MVINMTGVTVYDEDKRERKPFSGNVTSKSIHMTDGKLNRIGTEKKCNKCGKPFTIGEKELADARFDYKGNPKKLVEVVTESEFYINVELDTIDLSKYDTKGQAIIFGVEDIHTVNCPVCREENKNALQSDELQTCFGGKADRFLEE